MNTKTKIIVSIVALSVAYAVGRYASPEKIKIETHTVEVEKKTTDTKTDTDRDKHKVTTVTEIERPDGTKEKTTRTEEDTRTSKNTETQTKEDSSKSSSTSKETTYARSSLSVSALSGLKLSLSEPVSILYGAHVQKEVLGPISVGAWGLSNSTGGISVGIRF